MKQNNRFVWLDLIRGLSAIAVCASHLRAATLYDYAEVHSPTDFQIIFYFLTGLGHQSVMVFFVLSGFFVGGSILRSGKKFSAADYSIARFTRLWVVLIPTLLLTLAIDKILAIYAPEVLNGAYLALWNSGPISADSYSTSVLTFLGNVLFLQTILTPVFGTNGPLWSLANEFWYYVMFPLLAVALGHCYLTSRLRMFTRAASGIMATLLLFWLPDGIRSGYFVWLMGVFVYLVCCRLSCKRRPLALIVTFCLFSGSLVYSKMYAWQAVLSISSSIVIGLGFSALCIVVARWPQPEHSLLGTAIEKLASGTSEFSYSLYLFHFPIVVLIGVFGYGTVKVAPDQLGLLYFFAWLGVLLSLGAIFWYLFERHSIRVRRYFKARLITNDEGRDAAAQGSEKISG